MSIQFTGANRVTMARWRYTPAEGLVEIIRERGTPTVINGLVNAYAAAGYHVGVTRPRAYMNLFAQRITVGTGSPVQRWSVDTEILEKDIFTHPTAMTEAAAFAGGKVAYKNGIQTAFDDATALPSAYNSFPFAAKILMEKARGVEVIEHEYHILTKEQTFPAAAPEQLQLLSTRYIYTTDQLIALLNIPASVQFQLPDPGVATEPQTRWGWRTREQESEIDQDYKITHRQSWVFAQWSDFLYTPA